MSICAFVRVTECMWFQQTVELSSAPRMSAGMEQEGVKSATNAAPVLRTRWYILLEIEIDL